ncbi:glutamate-5-semialdehyde dehydrogenase [Streptomyces cylindrosporus]|uniref:Gamma-glutamyl phosphate reductase n=1 Tax=Streptomyces cylindrosporus TaxID=2927583 RepID=A0ABS9Y3M1_9ACTN|nr:glutamate-5-semialdehyde dehydrogenase [Streptomyces cylindrosporus]MCI3271286.1 glutamate-5-semialdehyde dehydrogenase [Streptomyces cylindrosporus]
MTTRARVRTGTEGSGGDGGGSAGGVPEATVPRENADAAIVPAPAASPEVGPVAVPAAVPSAGAGPVAAPATPSVREVAVAAQVAGRRLALTSGAERNAALTAIARRLALDPAGILAANERDVVEARAAGRSATVLDRLRLTREQLDGLARTVRALADEPDPVGQVVSGSVMPGGLEIRRVSVPLGVVGMIYEGRPNVTVDAAALCLKSANSALLRGSSTARHTNAALVDALREALAGTAVPVDAVQLVPGITHDSVRELMSLRGLVDVLVPRGGAELIRTTVRESAVPVIETGVGNCHVYVDQHADLDKALAILLNAKTQRPSVCNAAESLLVHEAVAADFLPRALKELTGRGVLVHGDEKVRAFNAAVVPATADDWDCEYLALELSAAVVGSLDEAVEHIRRHGTGHTEAIVTDSQSAARRFVASLDTAVVAVNASTRFADGGELGLGAELGISTQKLHARGPMGLAALTTTKYVLVGDGHIRGGAAAPLP